MAVSESRKKANAKWDKDNMSVLACKVRKEQADAFREYARKQGLTGNALLKDYVLSCIGQGDAAGQALSAEEAV